MRKGVRHPALLAVLSVVLASCDDGPEYSTTFNPTQAVAALDSALVGLGTMETASFFAVGGPIFSALTTPPSAPVQAGFPAAIDPTVLGKRFDYDAEAGAYVPTADAGVPANMVRFALYVPLSPEEGPLLPLQEAGELEITRSIVGSDTSARIVVRDAAEVVQLDFTMRRTTRVPVGIVAVAVDGVAGTGATRMEFEGVLPPIRVRGDAPFAYALRTYVPALGLRHRNEIQFLTVSRAVALELRRGSMLVKLAGSYVQGDPAFVLTATAGGRVFGRIVSTEEAGTEYQDAEGAPLAGEAFTALQQMFFATQLQVNMLAPLVSGVRPMIGLGAEL